MTDNQAKWIALAIVTRRCPECGGTNGNGGIPVRLDDHGDIVWDACPVCTSEYDEDVGHIKSQLENLIMRIDLNGLLNDPYAGVFMKLKFPVDNPCRALMVRPV